MQTTTVFRHKKTLRRRRVLFYFQLSFLRFFSVKLNPFFVRFIFGGDGALRAFGNADAAVNAGIGVDDNLRIKFNERADRANVNAGQAFHAGIINNRSHSKSPQN